MCLTLCYKDHAQWNLLVKSSLTISYLNFQTKICSYNSTLNPKIEALKTSRILSSVIRRFPSFMYCRFSDAET